MSTATFLRRPLRIRSLGALTLGALVTYWLWLHPPTPTWVRVAGRDGANSTLGFGAIYVVSKEDSPRRHGLLQSANVTELDLTIPVQPIWTGDDIAGHEKLGRGSLLAWLGHLHSLRTFLESGAETALILEDDVDWDIRLRSVQVPLVAAAVRTALSSESKSGSQVRLGAFPSSLQSPGHPTVFDGAEPAHTAAADKATPYPYGDPKLWDLLYLGHCGDYFHAIDAGFEDGHVKPADLARTPHVSFNDSTLSAPDDLHPWTASLMANLGVPESTRLVHRSVFPLCTFAYAITRAAAQRMIDDLVSLDGTDHAAYDIALLIACRDRDLRCWSVNPELFHHLPGTSMIGGIDKNTNQPPVDAKGASVAERRGESVNINCGFWKGAFSFPDGDTARLRYLQREVGRRGRCLKEGRERPA